MCSMGHKNFLCQMPICIYNSLCTYLFIYLFIFSVDNNEEIVTSQEQLTPEVAPLSPSSPPLHTMLSSSSEHSPHPSRRLLAVTTSNPNLTEEEPQPPPQTTTSNNFDRNHIGRRSLRVRERERDRERETKAETERQRERERERESMQDSHN